MGYVVLVVVVLGALALLFRPGGQEAKERRVHRDWGIGDAPSALALKEGLGIRARILYKDAEGNDTDREIQVLAIFGELADGLSRPYQLRYIRAYCRLRREQRTFRVDRITRLIDQETGEVLDIEDQDGEYLIWRYFADIVDGRQNARPYFDRTLASGLELPLKAEAKDGDVFEGILRSVEWKLGSLPFSVESFIG